MILKVYLIHATNDDGESLDWFVSAVDPDQAILLWRGFLVAGEWCDDEEAERYRPTTIALAPEPATTPMVHPWEDLFVVEPKEETP